MVTRDSLGQLSLDPDLYKEYLEKQQNQLDLTTRASYINQSILLNEQKQQTYDNISKYGKIMGIEISSDDINSLANLTSEEYTSKLEEIASKYYEGDKDS
jgi:hypothetical protein